MIRTRLLQHVSTAALLLMRPAFIAAPLLLLPALAIPAAAQSSPGYFIPPAQQPAAGPARGGPTRAAAAPARRRQVTQAPLPAPVPQPLPDEAPAPEGDVQQPTPNLPQPPVPALPPVEKGKAPPVAVVGVLGVPDVMRQSNAAQIIQRVIGARKEKLRVDVEHAQASWREMEQQLQADAPKLTPEQGRAREQKLRERVNADRRALQDRNKILQEAGQVSLGQIERTLVQIIRQVADSRGMNLVLHRSQVALNVQEFDVTDAVVAQLNKVLPTVQIPPDGVDPATLPKDWGSPPATAATAAPVAPPAKH